MSIGKLQAALTQLTSEVTLTAANINFDFCLVKFEAPEEYRPIGELLSASRKKNAEGGSSHVTARRLAALFDGICPDTPNLIRAYGKRVSEISKKVHSQELKDYSTSMFGSYAGVDATSIWAAATSSKGVMNGAIHVHLLACVLALMFEAGEAISIWVELVEERRKAIARSWEEDENIPFSTLAAAVQQGITRSQVAEWDSSARSWLQTADAIMVKEQTQLRLILENINLTMGPETTVYPSVIDTWRKTLRTMERLVSGVPQEVQDGSAILGLAAWHIYPVIHVFGSQNVEVDIQDPLVSPGGILSLGCSPSATTPSSGVSWSLSLAQFKYYGQPVRRKGAFKPDPNLITFKGLLLATLGCVLSRWGVSIDEAETARAVRIIRLLSPNSTQGTNNRPGNLPPASMPGFMSTLTVEGLRLLSEAAREYAEDEETSRPFVNLGRNRSQFLPSLTKDDNTPLQPQKYLRPFFGLDQVDNLLQCIRDPDGRVEFLRRIAARTKELQGHSCVIQYSDSVHRREIGFNYATVFPRHSDRTEDSQPSWVSHARWVHPDMVDTTRLKETVYPNQNYSVYRPSSFPRITCIHNPRQTDESILTSWYGRPEVAAIYVLWDDENLPRASSPKITTEDLLWCLEHDLLSPEACMRQGNDSITQTLTCLGSVNMDAFRTIPEPVIQVQTLEKPLRDADFMAELLTERPREPLSGSRRAISILSYFVAGHDIRHSKVPGNVIGMSIGNSIFVPQKVRTMLYG